MVDKPPSLAIYRRLTARRVRFMTTKMLAVIAFQKRKVDLLKVGAIRGVLDERAADGMDK